MTRAARDPIRVGVLGTGAISQIVHLPILSEREDVDVVAVSDEDVHKARTIAQRFGVPRVIPDAEMMADPEVEAIFLCTPNHLHEEQAVAALEGGKHVLVERPLAFTPSGCDRIVKVADEASRTVVVGMSHRFRPEAAALRSFVAGGELGDIYAVCGAWLNRKIPLPQATWRQRPEQAGGGALMDLGVQALDLCLWILDYPAVQGVRAVAYRDEYEVEEAATLLARLEGGVALSLEVSWGYFAGEDRHQVRLMGTEGAGSLPPLEIYKQLGGRPLEVTPRQPLPRGGENPYTNAYRREIDYFVRAILGEWDEALPREQAVLMGLVQAAYRSIEESREVEL